MTEKKTDPNNNANDMGGPSFHPDIEKTKNTAAPKQGADDKKQANDDGAILDEEQVPPL